MPKRFEILGNERDGNCLFYVIRQALALLKSDEAFNDQSVEVLRLCDYLTDHNKSIQDCRQCIAHNQRIRDVLANHLISNFETKAECDEYLDSYLVQMQGDQIVLGEKETNLFFEVFMTIFLSTFFCTTLTRKLNRFVFLMTQKKNQLISFVLVMIVLLVTMSSLLNRIAYRNYCAVIFRR